MAKQTNKKGVKTGRKAQTRVPRPLSRAPQRMASQMPRDPAAKYALALTSPFSEDAIGAKVPGMYAYPSVTRMLKANFNAVVDANGELSLLVLPHPVTTVVALTRTAVTNSIVGTKTWTFQTEATSTGTGITTVAGCSLAGFTDWPSIVGQASAWRVAGGGIRLIPTESLTTAKGLITAAPVPLAGEAIQPISFDGSVVIPGSNGVGVQNGDIAKMYGFPWGTANSGGSPWLYPSYLDGLPDSQTRPVAKLLEVGGLEANFRPCGPACMDWRAVDLAGNNAASGASLAIIAQGYNTPQSDFYVTRGQTLGSGKVDGFCGVALAGTGLTAGATVDLEVILHLEAEPAGLAANAASSFNQGGSADPPIPTARVEAALLSVFRSPVVKELGAMAGKAAAGYARKGLAALMPIL